eukprot:3016893-Pyramimonas_sp.AAC.1
MRLARKARWRTFEGARSGCAATRATVCSAASAQGESRGHDGKGHFKDNSRPSSCGAADANCMYLSAR